jgi:hypothetical protein
MLVDRHDGATKGGRGICHPLIVAIIPQTPFLILHPPTLSPSLSHTNKTRKEESWTAQALLPLLTYISLSII